MPASSFVSEPITVVGASFDPAGMAMGEPGLPQRFRWRKKEYTIDAVLEKWKEHGDCAHGSGERYVRKQRWWIHSVEESARALLETKP